MYFFSLFTHKSKQKVFHIMHAAVTTPVHSVKYGNCTIKNGKFRKCGTRFYPVRSGAVRYKFVVMARFD